MFQFIRDKTKELEQLVDPIIPPNIDIHCFEMVKQGSGYKTIRYKWSRNGIVDPYNGNDTILDQHKTLSKIKKDFGEDENNIVCVIDGNLTCPSTLFQLVIECNNIPQRDEIKNILIKHSGLNFTCMTEYEWLTDVPSELIKKLLRY